MKIPNYYNFLNTSDINKIFFVYNIKKENTNDAAEDFNKKMNEFIQKSLYEKIIILDELSTDEIKNLTFPINSVIYIYNPIDVYKNTSEKTEILIDTLKNKSVYYYINKNLSSSKVETQKILNNYDFIIPAVFDENDIEKTIGFPVVAKPEFGHSGEGIKKFNNLKEILDYNKNSKNIKHDLYTKFIDFEREFRAFFVDKKLVYLAERVTRETVNIDINNKKNNEQMAFVYAIQDIKKFEYTKEIINISKQINKHFSFDIFSVDFFLTKNKEIKFIEINSQTGLDPYRNLVLFENLYNSNFNYINSKRNQFIRNLKSCFLYEEYKKYKNEINKSLSPIAYPENISDLQKKYLTQFSN